MHLENVFEKENGIFFLPLLLSACSAQFPPAPPAAQPATFPVPLSHPLTGWARLSPSPSPTARPPFLPSLLYFNRQVEASAPTISPSPPRLGSKWRAPAHPSTFPSPISFCLASAPLESALKNRRRSAAATLRAKPPF